MEQLRRTAAGRLDALLRSWRDSAQTLPPWVWGASGGAIAGFIPGCQGARACPGLYTELRLLPDPPLTSRAIDLLDDPGLARVLSDRRVAEGEAGT